MTPAHTPGPWQIVPGTRWINSPTVDKFDVIAIVSHRETNEEADANARLVKAAPAMFDALEQIASLTKDGEPDDDGTPFEMSIDDTFETVNQIIQLARNTLKKCKTII